METEEQARADAARVVGAQRALGKAIADTFKGPVARFADEIAQFATAFYEKRGGVK